MKFIFLLLFVFVFQTNLSAQQMIARQVPFYDELPSNEIWDFYQDREGYIWVETTNGLVRYDGYRLQSFRTDHKSAEMFTNNTIVCMSDNDNYLWIGTRKGLNLLDKRTYKLVQVPETELRTKNIETIKTDKKNITWIGSEDKIYKCDQHASLMKAYALSNDGINCIYEDRAGDIWVLTLHKGLFKYDAKQDAFINYPRIGESNSPYTMFQDNAGNFWIGTWGDGLWQFTPDSSGAECYKRVHVESSKDGLSDPIFYSLSQDNMFGYLWALSLNELYALEITDEGLKKVEIDDLLDTRMMYTRIFKDRVGNLWLSSYDMAYTIFFDNSGITNYPLSQIKERLGWDANVLNMCLDNNIVWLMQDRFGVCSYDLSNEELSFERLPVTSIISKSSSGEGVWICERDGLNAARIVRLVRRNRNTEIKEEILLNKVSDNPGTANQLIEDRKGNLWILTSTHLFLKRKDNPSFIVAQTELPLLSELTLDAQGKMWAVGNDQKIYSLSAADNQIVCTLNSTLSVLSAKEEIKNICVDQKECLWIITSLGRVFVSDKEKENFHNVALEDEIEDSSVLSLLTDKENVWVITNKKVIRYNIDDHSTAIYSTSAGSVFVSIFRHKAVTRDGKGGIYVGGHGGFIHIPYRQENKNEPVAFLPVVTDIKVDNQSVLFTSDDSGNTIDKVHLTSDARNIEILFSTLHYQLTPKAKVAYKLEGVDADWIYPDEDKNSAFYNQLSKGTYRFLLKYEIRPGEWSDEKVLLMIDRRPAIYETWYAYSVYVLVALLSVYLLLRVWSRRLKRKNELRFREELNKAKLDYFTNISHDVLTPLTIISGAADSIENKETAVSKEAVVIKSNVNKLKRLIQQMLDFRKMDMNRLPLNVTYGDIAHFISRIIQTAFVPLAQKKNIQLQIDLPSELDGYVDFDKLDKMLYNLLSNALKYTPENKRITISAQQRVKKEHPMLILKVQDEGIGIPHEEQEDIFTRFYVNKHKTEIESNGIGLSLTKDLITLHHGSISVESEQGQGACFTVELPIDKESYAPEELVGRTEKMENSADVGPKKFRLPIDNSPKMTLLLIDDNTELLYVMQELFQESYRVLTAVSAKQGREELNRNDVDIVICDVVMPDENGWEFCKQLKADVRFNHIPVVILTAKNDKDDRVTSYEAGADAYMAKPFEIEVLRARVNNLAKSYRSRQDAFRQEQDIALESMAEHSADKQFLQMLIERIESSLNEAEFDMEQLSSQLNMSKSTLYRKIKTITGMTPLDFIRNIKMKRACMMLRAKNLSIAEVAYAVGYNNPRYFSRCFKDEFGITPSEYLQSV